MKGLLSVPYRSSPLFDPIDPRSDPQTPVTHSLLRGSDFGMNKKTRFLCI